MITILSIARNRWLGGYRSPVITNPVHGEIIVQGQLNDTLKPGFWTEKPRLPGSFVCWTSQVRKEAAIRQT